MSPTHIEKKSGSRSAIGDWNGAKQLCKACKVFYYTLKYVSKQLPSLTWQCIS